MSKLLRFETWWVKLVKCAGTQNVSDALTKSLTETQGERNSSPPFSGFFSTVETTIAPVVAFRALISMIILARRSRPQRKKFIFSLFIFSRKNVFSSARLSQMIQWIFPIRVNHAPVSMVSSAQTTAFRIKLPTFMSSSNFSRTPLFEWTNSRLCKATHPCRLLRPLPRVPYLEISASLACVHREYAGLFVLLPLKSYSSATLLSTSSFPHLLFFTKLHPFFSRHLFQHSCKTFCPSIVHTIFSEHVTARQFECADAAPGC
jgi:hypothetical protein